jgi:hypothetical protein
MTTQHESLKNTGPTFLSFATCGASALTTYRRSTSSAVGSRANRTAMPVSEKEAPTPATCGASSPESFASLTLDGFWLKMCQGYFQARTDDSLDVFSGTWPRAGTMQSGTAYRLPPLVPLTDVIGSSSWPTPRAREIGDYQYSRGDKTRPTLTLTGAARMWPTPRAPPNENRQRKPTPSQLAANRWSGLQSHGRKVVLGTPNPQFVEYLMGFPLDWSKVDSED